MKFERFKKKTGEPGSPEKRKSSLKLKFLAVLPGLILLCLPIAVNASDAGGLQSTQLVQGAKKLFEDGAKVGVFLEAVILTALEIKEGIAMQAAAVEEKPKHKKNMISMAGVGVLIICITALVPVLFGYFQ